MYSYASPIRRDGFLYNGKLYVEIEQNRHERQDPTTLHGLLTYVEPPPLRTKAGKIAKRQPPPHKDLPGHFYCAQLVHYGLKPLKTRDAAKKSLLNAFGGGKTLAVPEHIIQLEKALKEEYARATEEALVAHKRQVEHSRREEEKKRQKRVKEYEVILKEFTDLGVTIHLDAIDRSSDESPNVKKLTRSELRSAIQSFPEHRLRQVVSRLVNEIPELKRAMRLEISKLPTSSATMNNDNMVVNLDPKEYEGQFNIIAPYLSDQWPSSTERMTLKMCPSSTSSHLWVSFDFGIVTGVFRSCAAPPEAIGTLCPFMWRGRETGEGETDFSDDNIGHIVFLGGGKIKGRMAWAIGDFEFVGKKVDQKKLVLSKSVRKWKSEWRSINPSNYESARVGRWGGWGSEPVNDKPMYSDTSDSGADDSEGNDSDDDGYRIY